MRRLEIIRGQIRAYLDLGQNHQRARQVEVDTSQRHSLPRSEIHRPLPTLRKELVHIAWKKERTIMWTFSTPLAEDPPWQRTPTECRKKAYSRDPSLSYAKHEVNIATGILKIPYKALIPIMFTDEDAKDVARVLVDTRSLVDILFDVY